MMAEKTIEGKILYCIYCNAGRGNGYCDKHSTSGRAYIEGVKEILPKYDLRPYGYKDEEGTTYNEDEFRLLYERCVEANPMQNTDNPMQEWEKECLIGAPWTQEGRAMLNKISQEKSLSYAQGRADMAREMRGKVEEAIETIYQEYNKALKNEEDGEANGYAHSLAIAKDLLLAFQTLEDNNK